MTYPRVTQNDRRLAGSQTMPCGGHGTPGVRVRQTHVLLLPLLLHAASGRTASALQQLRISRSRHVEYVTQQQLNTAVAAVRCESVRRDRQKHGHLLSVDADPDNFK